MRLPFWLLHLLPIWEYICPKCRKTVKKNSRECHHCGERFPLAIRVPPSLYKDPKALEDYVHKHIFPKVSQAHRDYLARFFTEIFSDGFESGNFSAWTGTVGTPSIISDSVHHDSYACSCDIGDGDGIYKSFTSVSEVYGRLYFQIDALPAAYGKTKIFSFYDTGFVEYILYVDRSDGGNEQWALYIGAGSSYKSGAVTINVDTWYCVEFRLVKSDSAGVMQLWVDGTLKIDETGLNTGTNNVNQIWLAPTSVGTNTMIYDCVVVADAYIGPEEEGTFVEVADSLELAETVLRNKALILSDSLGLADSLYGNKSLLLSDSASLSELVTVIIGEVLKQVTDSVTIADVTAVLKTLKTTDTVTLADAALTPSRVLQALETIGLADNSVVNKVLQITETVSLAEVVQVGAGGVKKTKLFLILGDLAVQLTGD